MVQIPIKNACKAFCGLQHRPISALALCFFDTYFCLFVNFLAILFHHSQREYASTNTIPVEGKYWFFGEMMLSLQTPPAFYPFRPFSVHLIFPLPGLASVSASLEISFSASLLSIARACILYHKVTPVPFVEIFSVQCEKHKRLKHSILYKIKLSPNDPVFLNYFF